VVVETALYTGKSFALGRERSVVYDDSIDVV